MNEHLNQPESNRPSESHPPLEWASLTSNPDVYARWAEGLLRWGEAFTAFSRLGVEDFHTTDVLVAFEDLYIGSFDSLEDVAQMQIEANGWGTALERFRREHGISADVLDWSSTAINQQLRYAYDLVESGGQIHLFSK